MSAPSLPFCTFQMFLFLLSVAPVRRLHRQAEPPCSEQVLAQPHAVPEPLSGEVVLVCSYA